MISWPLVVVTFHGTNRRTVNCLKRCYSQSPSELIGRINNMQWMIPSFLGCNPNMHISFVSFQCRDNIPKYQQNWENNLTLYIIYIQASFLTFMKFLWRSFLSFFMKGKYVTHWTWHSRHQRDREGSRRFSFLISKICCLTMFFKKNQWKSEYQKPY